MKRTSLLLFLLLWILAACVPQTPQGSSLQDPDIPRFTTETGFVIDTTNTLSAEQEAALEAQAQHLDDIGYQTVIVIFENCACDTTLFATEIGQHNGIGDAETDNGIVVALFTQKEGSDGNAPAIGVATGYGAEIVLNDAKVGRLLDAVYVPARSQGNWVDGTQQFLQAVSDVINNIRDIEEYQVPSQEIDPMLILIGVIVFVVFLILDGIFFQFQISVLLLRIAAAGKGGSSSLGGGGSFGGGGASR